MEYILKLLLSAKSAKLELMNSKEKNPASL